MAKLRLFGVVEKAELPVELKMNAKIIINRMPTPIPAMTGTANPKVANRKIERVL